MYANMSEPGLGFSLKPPSWLVQAVQSLTRSGAATVPTPGGGTVTVTTPSAYRPTPASTTFPLIEQIPGGWLTVAAVGVGLIFLLKRR